AGVGIFLETSVLIGLIVPGDTIVIVAATAVDTPAEFLALVGVVIVGALGGESVGFALGRFFGPRIRHSRLGRRLGEHNWRRAEYYVDRRGGIAQSRRERPQARHWMRAGGGDANTRADAED